MTTSLDKYLNSTGGLDVTRVQHPNGQVFAERDGTWTVWYNHGDDKLTSKHVVATGIEDYKTAYGFVNALGASLNHVLAYEKRCNEALRELHGTVAACRVRLQEIRGDQ